MRIQPGLKSGDGTLLRARRHISQRSEAACDQVGGQPRARGKQQREQVIVGARQRVLAEPSRGMHRPPEQRPLRRFARVFPRHRRPEHRWSITQSRAHPGPAARPLGVGYQHQADGIQRSADGTRGHPPRELSRVGRTDSERRDLRRSGATAPLTPPGERAPRDQAASRSRAAQATRGVAPVTRRRASPRPPRTQQPRPPPSDRRRRRSPRQAGTSWSTRPRQQRPPAPSLATPPARQLDTRTAARQAYARPDARHDPAPRTSRDPAHPRRGREAPRTARAPP